MIRFHTTGLRIGALLLSSLGLAIASPSATLAMGTVASFSTKALSVTSPLDTSHLSPGLIDSDEPVPIAQGEGGDFSYQIWQEPQASDYYLFIWDSETVPSQDAVRVMGHTVMPASIEMPLVSYNFHSAAAAIDFFTCRYARERLSFCGMTTMSSVSYDVPATCAFPWVDCKEP